MPQVGSGIGQISLQSHGQEAVFSHLSYSYPLKLLSPKVAQPNVAVVYVLSYGGGLVGGDHIKLSVNVERHAILVMLTQGSTKVFKVRPGQTRSARSQDPSLGDITGQSLDVTIAADGALFLLPDPVTCFRSAKYNQMQIFRLSRGSSAVLLDWITSGRKSLGEDWAFSRYYSLNEVWIEGKRVARDALLLEDQVDGGEVKVLPPRTLADRLGPYSCYATVIIYGPLAHPTIKYLKTQYEATTIFKCLKRPDLVWSFSPICDGQGSIVRVAAKETEDVRHWLGAALHQLEGVIGTDIFRKTFS